MAITNSLKHMACTGNTVSRFAAMAAVALMTSGAAFTQDDPKIEATVVYSYVRATPQNQNHISPFSLNGGGADVAFFFNKVIGIKAEIDGYGSATHFFTIPPQYCPSGTCSGNVQGNLFTYNVGPELKFRAGHFEPFVEVLFGGSHSNLYGNLKADCTGCTVSKSPSNNAWNFVIGGGVDVPVNKKIAIRIAQFDYFLSRFGNNFTSGNNNQSNFRFQAGLQFRLP